MQNSAQNIKPFLVSRIIRGAFFFDRTGNLAGAFDSFHRGELDQTAAQLKIEHYWAGALRRAVVDGDVEAGSLMAGQSVGMVKSIQPAAEILEELVDQAHAALEGRGRARVAG